MSSRHKKFPISAKHGRECTTRDKVDSDKGVSPRLEVGNHSHQETANQSSQKQPFAVKNMHQLNAAILAAQRIEEFRRNQ